MEGEVRMLLSPGFDKVFVCLRSLPLVSCVFLYPGCFFFISETIVFFPNFLPLGFFSMGERKKRRFFVPLPVRGHTGSRVCSLSP